MKTITNRAEYTMEHKGDGFTFSVKEDEDFCEVGIEHITERGAILFFKTIVEFDVRACQLTAVAEDSMLELVTEIFRGLL